MLDTALVYACDGTGAFQSARALVDLGSQISANTVVCTKRWSRYKTPITGLTRVPVSKVRWRVDCHMVPRFAVELFFQASFFLNVISDLPRSSLNLPVKNKYSRLALTAPTLYAAKRSIVTSETAMRSIQLIHGRIRGVSRSTTLHIGRTGRHSTSRCLADPSRRAKRYRCPHTFSLILAWNYGRCVENVSPNVNLNGSLYRACKLSRAPDYVCDRFHRPLPNTLIYYL